MDWSKKGIFKSVEMIEQLTGLTCQYIRELPKNSKIKDLNIAWEKDRSFFKGLANDISIWC